MTTAITNTATIIGIDAHVIEGEADVSIGLGNFSIVGLPDGSIKESKDRVMAALNNACGGFPIRKVVINLAPADIRKVGTGFDLPIAMAILEASKSIPENALRETLIIGELSLDGIIRPIDGILAVALAAKKAGVTTLVVPEENGSAASLVDGLTNAPNPELSAYLSYPTTEIAEDDLDDFHPEDAIVVPPQARATAVVRDILIGMIKSVQADRIIEDRIDVERVDLYYRPVYAFQYRWHAKEKEAIVEYDGMTGKMQTGGKTFQQYAGQILDPEFLFDISIEAVDLLVPGGGLAIKLAKKGIEVAKSRTGG